MASTDTSSTSDQSNQQSTSSTRLYISNLHPTIDEFTLIQLFSKFGSISKLDFLFNKAGPNKGQPRGYCFLEFSKKEDAMNALVEVNGNVFRGRKIEVGWAKVSQYEPSKSSIEGGVNRRNHRDDVKPTTLSLLKNSKKPEGGIDGKIRAMEKKLELMRANKDKGKDKGEVAAGAGKKVVGGKEK